MDCLDGTNGPLRPPMFHADFSENVQTAGLSTSEPQCARNSLNEAGLPYKNDLIDSAQPFGITRYDNHHAINQGHGDYNAGEEALNSVEGYHASQSDLSARHFDQNDNVLMLPVSAATGEPFSDCGEYCEVPVNEEWQSEENDNDAGPLAAPEDSSNYADLSRFDGSLRPVCAVCRTGRVYHLLVPCGHACLCANCHSQQLNQFAEGASSGVLCPLCLVPLDISGDATTARDEWGEPVTEAYLIKAAAVAKVIAAAEASATEGGPITDADRTAAAIGALQALSPVPALNAATDNTIAGNNNTPGDPNSLTAPLPISTALARLGHGFPCADGSRASWCGGLVPDEDLLTLKLLQMSTEANGRLTRFIRTGTAAGPEGSMDHPASGA